MARPLGADPAHDPKFQPPRSRRRVRLAPAVRLALVTLVCALGALAWAWQTRPHVGQVRLFAFERRFSTKSEALDFASAAISSSALDGLAARLPADVSKRDLSERCQVAVEPGQSFIVVTARAESPAAARTLVGAFAGHVAQRADEWGSRRGEEGERQIAAAQRRLAELRSKLGPLKSALQQSPANNNAFAPSTQVAPEILAPEALALRSVQQELAQALTRFTEEHPRVKELRASIAALQREIAAQATKPASIVAVKPAEPKAQPEQPAGLSSAQEVEAARLQAEFSALSTYRDQLIQARVVTGSKDSEKWRQAEQVTLARVTETPRLFGYYSVGAVAGLVLAGAGQRVGRRRRRVIRDQNALEEATQLPVLAVVPPLKGMSEAAKDYWAVETLNLIRRTARADRRGCFVCGVISAGTGEGRSTVIDLLATAGLRTGNRVLVIPTPDFSQPGNTVVVPSPAKDIVAVARQTLMLEAGNNSLPVHWERAFTTWQHEENALVLVELPPASTADALVYSSGVPNVLWLSAANVAETETTARCVTSLRNSGCHLIGAALNMCSSMTKRAALWLALAAVAFASVNSLHAQEPVLPAPTNGISFTKTPALAPWQERLTLGPGDALEVSLYGQKETTRQVVIGPDGRFSYLQAVDVTGTGFTVDELRGKLEQILMKFHLAPRVVMSPLAFASKKYYVLGNVQARGAYPLDKPVTLVEAVARARGFMTVNPQRSSFTLTDFTQAFLMRRQADGSFGREPVDFESLFERGELQHNKMLAPDDYLYFPPTSVEEVYLLGEVRGTGPLTYTKDLSVLGAIAGRGGFTDAAFKERILVIRGSLSRPETFVVDIGKILRAADKDFKLQPRDIVYVSRKPWQKAAELLEAAASDFMRAAVVTWTGQQIGPLFP